jgi:hypothetical protein
MYNERRVFAIFHRTPGYSTPSGFSIHAGSRGMIEPACALQPLLDFRTPNAQGASAYRSFRCLIF